MNSNHPIWSLVIKLLSLHTRFFRSFILTCGSRIQIGLRPSEGKNFEYPVLDPVLTPNKRPVIGVGQCLQVYLEAKGQRVRNSKDDLTYGSIVSSIHRGGGI